MNGSSRSDLDGCDEVDLSITPFCNMLVIKRLGLAPGSVADATALYLSFPDLTSVPSRQRYERLDATTVRYVDLGAVRGFQAVHVDSLAHSVHRRIAVSGLPIV